MSIKFTELPVLAGVDVADDDILAIVDVSAGVSKQVTRADLGYACRAWVNFNGTGTVAIRAAGNVSSITDNGTGSYAVNFATAMPDANYAKVATASNNSLFVPQGCLVDYSRHINTFVTPTTTSFAVSTIEMSGSYNGIDALYLNCAVFA
jgi:hypothetical protein